MGIAVVSRDYTHEPMYTIFCMHDKDNDGYLMRGQVKGALKDAGVIVVDEERAFDWLDRNFEGKLCYKYFRRACTKAAVVCKKCNNNWKDDYMSSDSECEQEDLLRTYWIKFDPEKRGYCYADNVIDYLAADWGIEVDPAQRVIESKLMGADTFGKINYRNFKKYFTQVPEDDLKHRVSSIGQTSNLSMKNFEAQLDDMLFSDNRAAAIINSA